MIIVFLLFNNPIIYFVTIFVCYRHKNLIIGDRVASDVVDAYRGHPALHYRLYGATIPYSGIIGRKLKKTQVLTEKRLLRSYLPCKFQALLNLS